MELKGKIVFTDVLNIDIIIKLILQSQLFIMKIRKILFNAYRQERLIREFITMRSDALVERTLLFASGVD